MVTIIRDVPEIPSCLLSELKVGDFFEYGPKLYAFISLKVSNVLCLNITDNISCEINIDTVVHKCNPIKIIYGIKGEE